MSRFSITLAVLLALAHGHSVWGQTWTINTGTSAVLLNADAFADDFTVPGFDMDVQTDGTFQFPFVDLMGGNFTIGENISASALDGAVHSDSASVVKANDGSSLSIEWRAATDLEMSGDTNYVGNAHSDLGSTLEVELSGLIPGKYYEVSYSYGVDAIAIEDHEGALEDPEDAASSLSFTFGTAPMINANAMAGPSAGFLPVDGTGGSGSYLLLATAAPIGLIVDVSAISNASFADPPIQGSPPEDGAGSEGFGFLNFRAVLVPEPSSLFLLLAAGLMLGVRRRRRG
ncbi:MAG: PEP-CTERM sorting domain-containing protein [Pirellulales bacterium]